MVHELILTKSIYIRTPLYSVHRSSHFLVEMSRGIRKCQWWCSVSGGNIAGGADGINNM